MTVVPEELARPEERRYILGLEHNVFVLGWVSFLTDVSSDMTITLLPLFLANVLGVKTAYIGLIEGVAEATASLLKIFSGWLSDKVRRRKVLVGFGYGLSALSKPFLGVVSHWGEALFIRFADRVGKGVRTSPRDALLADSSTAKRHGRAFGFHRAMDTGGAVVGLSAAALIIYLSQRTGLLLGRATYQTIVLVAVIPAFVAVALVWLFVRERRAAGPGERLSLGFRGLDRRFKIFLLIIVIFTLGNSSDAFLTLRAQNVGLSVLEITLMLVAFNVLYAAVSMPAGVLSDRLGRRRLIVFGWGIYGLIYLGFALARSPWQVWALYALYGLYYGTTEGVSRALVADLVPSGQRATAYGLYHAAVGLTALPASFIAGLLWQTIGPAAPFLFGAGLALLSTFLLLGWLQMARPGE